MIAVLQRVSSASVTVAGELIGAVDNGLCILLGVAADDTEADSKFLADKSVFLRIFADDAGKLNRSLLDIQGAALVVSQFTLISDWRKGRRPSFTKAAQPALGEQLYEHFMQCLLGHGVTVASGRFGALMDVALVNAGPVTLVLDSKER